jgi:hypothetical protein
MQGQQLGSGFGVGPEHSTHGTRHCVATLLDATHTHARVLCRHDNADALRLQVFLDGVCELSSEALLNLQPVCVAVKQASQLRQTDNT